MVTDSNQTYHGGHFEVYRNLKKKNFFYWSIVTLQCCVSSAVQQSESAMSIHISPPFWISFPSMSSQSTELTSSCYNRERQQVPTNQLFYTQQCIYVNPNLPIHPTLPFPPHVHMSILYTCISIAALQIGSSVPFFQIPHICVNIQYLFFSF